MECKWFTCSYRKRWILEYLEESNADIFCLQEIKLQEGQIDLNVEGYYTYWNYAVKKDIQGRLFFEKEPLSVTYGLGIEEHDQEGRVITLEFEDFYIITLYTPNSKRGLERLDYRMKWEDDFRVYIKRLDEKTSYFCGDLNVAHKEIDLKIRKVIVKPWIL